MEYKREEVVYLEVLKKGKNISQLQQLAISKQKEHYELPFSFLCSFSLQTSRLHPYPSAASTISRRVSGLDGSTGSVRDAVRLPR